MHFKTLLNSSFTNPIWSYLNTKNGNSCDRCVVWQRLVHLLNILQCKKTKQKKNNSKSTTAENLRFYLFLWTTPLKLLLHWTAKFFFSKAILSIPPSTWLWYLAGWSGVRALPGFGSDCEKSHPPSSSSHSQSWSVCPFPCSLKDDSTPLDCWEHPAEEKLDLAGSHTSRLPLYLPRLASPLEWPQRGTQADCDNKARRCRTHRGLLEVSPKPELSAYKEHRVIYILTTVSLTSPPYLYSSYSQSLPHADHELMHLSVHMLFKVHIW